MRGDERRQGRRDACACTSVNGGDGWRPACNSDAFRMVWVEGIRLGGWMVSSDVGGDDASCNRGYRHAVHRYSGASLRSGYLSGISVTEQESFPAC